MSWIRQTKTIYTHYLWRSRHPSCGSQVLVGIVFDIRTSHLFNCTWVKFQLISTWLKCFSLGIPVFLPLQNGLPVEKNKTKQKQLALVLCSRIMHDHLMVAIEAPFIIIHSGDPVEVHPLQFSPWAASKGD